MAYIDNTEITLTATLTKRGRQILSEGGKFKITKYAFADDEIDYSLWQPNHPNGTNSYGAVIEALPMLEPFIDETQTMKNKLVTLPKKTSRMPIIDVGSTSIVLRFSGARAEIVPNTRNADNSTLGYTCILHNSDAASLSVVESVDQSFSNTLPIFLGDADTRRSVSAIGKRFAIVAKEQPYQNLVTKITIYGNQTGGTKTIDLTIQKRQNNVITSID